MGKKETWNFNSDGRGTKTTTYTSSSGSRTVTQRAHKNALGMKRATSIIRESTTKKK